MKNASDNNMSLGEDMQATNTCSKRKHNGAKLKEILSARRQYIWRSELNKSSTNTKISRGFPGKIFVNTSINSINFDTRARDESSVNRENAIVHMCKETGVVMQEIDRSGWTGMPGTKIKERALQRLGMETSVTFKIQQYNYKWLIAREFILEPLNILNMQIAEARIWLGHTTMHLPHTHQCLRSSFQKSMHTEKVATIVLKPGSDRPVGPVQPWTGGLAGSSSKLDQICNQTDMNRW